MTLKFDVPIIFDDHYMMLKGNKKVIEHTVILKPLVKTGKDTVQIVSNYQKMFIMRKGSLELKSNALLKNVEFAIYEAKNSEGTNYKYYTNYIV